MVLAREDSGGALLLSDDWECTVATDVVEAVDVVFPVTGQDEFVLGNVELEVVARLLEAGGVCDELPLAREDCTPLKFVHFLRGVPFTRQSTDC